MLNLDENIINDLKDSFLYNKVLNKKKLSSELSFFPPTSKYGKEKTGIDITNGIVELNGHMETGVVNPWFHITNNKFWLSCASTFEWLNDLRCCNCNRSKKIAIDWTFSWMSIYKNDFDDPVVCAKRLVSIIVHYKYFFSSLDKFYQRIIFSYLYDSFKYLKDLNLKKEIASNLLVLKKAILISSLSFDYNSLNKDNEIMIFINIIINSLDKDGFSNDRDVSEHMNILSESLDLKLILNKINYKNIEDLNKLLRKMIKVAKFFQHPNGKFSNFGNKVFDSKNLVSKSLDIIGSKIVAYDFLKRSKFIKLKDKNISILADYGYMKKNPIKSSVSTFELSISKKKVFVNCGLPLDLDSEIYNPLRSSSAHNSVTVNDEDCINLDKNNKEIISTGEVIKKDEEKLLVMTNSGYYQNYGIFLQRRILVNGGKKNILGNEIITSKRLNKSKGSIITIRFHLHPGIISSPYKSGFILKVGNEGWFFSISNSNTVHKFFTSNSIYIDDLGIIKPTKQIEISFKCIRVEHSIFWNLNKM